MACTEYEVSADMILNLTRTYAPTYEATVVQRIAGRECVSHNELLAEAENLGVNLRPYGLPYDFSGPSTTTAVVADRAFTSTATMPARAGNLPATGGTETRLLVGGTLALIVGVFMARASRRAAVG